MNNNLAIKFFTDDVLFEEIAHRLRRRSVDLTGRDIRYGEVVFIFHDGKFQMVEERSKNRIFKSSAQQLVSGGSV